MTKNRGNSTRQTVINVPQRYHCLPVQGDSHCEQAWNHIQLERGVMQEGDGQMQGLISAFPLV